MQFRLMSCPQPFPTGSMNGGAASIFTFLGIQPSVPTATPRSPTMNAMNSDIRRASLVFLAALFLLPGCSRKEEAQPGPTTAKPPPGRPALASAEKTSFQEVTSQLDPGGNLFAYFGTEQWISGASDYVSRWRGILEMVPT